MSERHACVDCGGVAPPTNTDYTLISAQHGWRLNRTRMPDGIYVVEWRCPTCWQKFKATKAGGPPSSGRAPEAPRPSTPPTSETPRSIFARAARRLGRATGQSDH